jgi:hypothetical protein
MTPELNLLLVKARALATELRTTLEEIKDSPEAETIIVQADDSPELLCNQAGMNADFVGISESWLDDLELQGHWALLRWKFIPR